MQLACPQCGTRDIRVSQRQDFSEMLKGLVGIYPLRCRRCHFRWLTSTWASGAWKFARCPRCYRQELTTWSEQYYRPPFWTVFLLRTGATPYRCAACRCNFASFRPCKEKFLWRHETKQEPLPPVGPEQIEKQEPDRGGPIASKTPASAPTPRAGANGQPPVLVPRVSATTKAGASAQPKPADRLATSVPPAPPKVARSVADEPEEDLL